MSKNYDNLIAPWDSWQYWRNLLGRHQTSDVDSDPLFEESNQLIRTRFCTLHFPIHNHDSKSERQIILSFITSIIYI